MSTIRILTLPLLVACARGANDKTPTDSDAPEITHDPAQGDAVVSQGACLGSPYRPEPPDPDSGEPYEAHPSLTATAEGSTVSLVLVETTINCCPSPAASWSRADSTYTVTVLSETASEACGCLCVMDLTVPVTDVPDGTWTFEVSLDGSSFGSAEVVVGG